jgi:AcrR family transcriptional regulator
MTQRSPQVRRDSTTRPAPAAGERGDRGAPRARGSRSADEVVADPTVDTEDTGGGRTAASERVLASGVQLFSSVGFLATTIRELTASCGITAAAFYNHFESKEALLYTIISEANKRLNDSLDALTLDDDDPAGSLRMLVNVLVTYNVTYPKQARIANREYVFLQDDRRQEVIDHRRRVRAMFEDVLASPQTARGLGAPDTHPNPDALEIRLLAISIVNISIASSDWFHRSGPLSIAEFADTHSRLALRMAGLVEHRSARRTRRRA